MTENPSILNPSYEEFTLYSRADLPALPSKDNNLTNTFSAQEYLDVENLDGQTSIQTSNGQYSVFLFKNKNTDQETISTTWTGKSNLAPSSSTVYLQIYNRTSTTWETLDTDSISSVDTNFTLTGTQTTNLSNYFDDNYWISCRVYQQTT